MVQTLEASLRYYGISPWEIEVFYGLLNSHFTVVQDEVEPFDPSFVSHLDLDIPLDFSEAFFKWFDFKRWERVKDILKEMKRRRGSSNALRVIINFSGTTKITFTVDVQEKQWFGNALEKIDFVLELLPYHTNPAKLPPHTKEITYRFDIESARWRLENAIAKNGCYFTSSGDGWHQVS